MTSPETIFEDREHEYRIAGWLGTIAVMKEIGAMNLRNVHIPDKGTHNGFLLDIC